MSIEGSTLFVDCYAGIAGDMALGALLDLGVPEGYVRAELERLGDLGYRLEVGEVMRRGMRGKKVRVVMEDVRHPLAHEHPAHGQSHHSHGHGHSHDHGVDHPEPEGDESSEGHPHVHYGTIREMIVSAGLSEEVLRRSLDIFDRLAAVEAHIHNVPVDEVQFHELGAVDSIVDIVGTAAALAYLRPERVVCRRVPLGGGTVRTAHGRIPVPAPATLALLKGAPVEAGGAGCELTTPTGAAILAATVDAYGELPAMSIVATGLGAGDRDLADRPNLLRLIAGIPAPEGSAGSAGSRCLVIETNLDDMSPQLYQPLMETLLEKGVRDVWLVPLYMKKGRPGIMFSVLVEPHQRRWVEDLLLKETTSLGTRCYAVDRAILDRTFVNARTRLGDVKIKLGLRNGEVWNVAPEFESCVELARKLGLSTKEVYIAAVAAAESLRKQMTQELAQQGKKVPPVSSDQSP